MDHFEQTTRVGYGQKLGKSIKGVLVGFILVVVSIGMLYWNEGQQDLSKIAKKSVILSPESVTNDQTLEGKLVSVTGAINSEGKLGDGTYLNPADYVYLKRNVEMYSWIEKKNTSTKSNTGGSDTVTTTYDYKKDWIETPAESSSFAYSDGHSNPRKSLPSEKFLPNQINVGAYSVANLKDVSMPSGELIFLDYNDVTITEGMTIEGRTYLYVPTLINSSSTTSNYLNPQIGDLRIIYHAIKKGTNSTVMGKLERGSISAYIDKKDNRIHHVFDSNRDDALATLHSSYLMILWLLRFVGLLFLWTGLFLILAPLSTVLSIIPLLSGISSFLLALVTFVLALVIGVAVMIVSAIIHSLIALVVTVIIVAVLVVIWLKRKKKGVVETVMPSNNL